MCTRPAKEQSIQRSSVLCPTRNRTHKEKLIERHVSVKDISSGQRVLALEVQRRNHLTMNNRILDSGRVLRQSVETAIGELFLYSIPVGVLQSVRRVLRKDAHDVFARRRY